jgi:hypothetical protein
MVGEEGRAQVTAGYRQTTEEANANHPRFFSPLGVYGLPHINSKTISGSDASSNSIIPISLFDPTGTLLPYSLLEFFNLVLDAHTLRLSKSQ